MDDTEETTQETFFTSCGTLSTDAAIETVRRLTNQACEHQFLCNTAPTPQFDVATPILETFLMDSTSRYGSDHFYGIVVDTGAAKRSTAGIAQFEAFKRLVPTSLNESTKGRVNV